MRASFKFVKAVVTFLSGAEAMFTQHPLQHN
jgi:hypothetical protein